MKTVIVVAVLWLLGLSWAKIDQVKNYKQSFHPNYPAVRQRFARAQPAIYAPDKALSWVDNYYERSYAPQPYSFGYEVNDGNNNYGHQQESDGSVTTGSYRVLLPDGRTQIVNFRADKNGYVADVKYEVSLFSKPSSSSSSSYSNRAPAAAPAPSYKVPAKSASPKAWTAFTQFKPAAKRASYKSDLIAAYGSKVIQDGPGRPAGSYKVLDGNEIEYVQPTTPTTPSYVIAEPIDAYDNDPTTPVYYQNPATTEYQASTTTTTTTTPAPTTAERDDAIVDSVGAWTAFKEADEITSAPIYEAKAVYRVIPETDYATSDPRPASESYVNDRAPAIIPAESSSSSQDVRISPAYGEVESTSTTPYQAAPSTQTYRVAPVSSSPQYEIATPEDADSPGPSTPAYSVQPPVRPAIQPPSAPKIPEITSYDEPERPSTETSSPTDAVPAGAAPWSAFRQLPAANRIRPVPFYAREGYVAPTTFKPPIAIRFASSASAGNSPARPAAAASSRRVSSAPDWTAWKAFRPTHHQSSAATTLVPSNSRLPSPLIFRQRKV